MSKFKRAFGFALMELLVVIGIIALLMGILTPSLSKAKQQAGRTACAANLRSIGMGFQMYIDDNSGIMPISQYFSFDPNKPFVSKALMPYLSDPEIFKCPCDTVDKYYDRYKSSYEYNNSLSNQAYLQLKSGRRHKTTDKKNIQVMYDRDNYHNRGRPKIGELLNPPARNYLYADWHVGNGETQ